VSGALLLLGSEDEGTYAAAAVWPDATRNLQALGPAAERALKERRGIVMAPDGVSPPARDQAAHVGYPIEVSGKLHGAVVLDIVPSHDQELQRALRLVHWASAWMVDQIRQQALQERDLRLAKLALAADLVATVVQEQRFAPSVLAVVNEIAARLQCGRVSLGFEQAGSIKVQAISHTAVFDQKSNLVRLIGDAMDEVLDLDVAIVYPQGDEDELGAIAHAELAREVKDIAVCSVPLLSDNHTVGVLSLERSIGEPFDASTLELAKTLGLLLGPILQLKRDNERGTLLRAHDGLRQGIAALFGPRHPGVKLIALVAVGLLIFLSLTTGEYRVSAKTVIEGAVQRAAVAPFDGYISESRVRAGDTVKKGQVLCHLDEKDLRLEHTKLASEREQSSRKYRQALAEPDRAAMAVIAAQINQAEAQLSLVEEKLARATLVAPFDGIVVSGDLSQLLGAPVEQGKILFEIAPLDAYRVILKVDERDVAQLKVGQPGELALSGIPNEVMHFAVKQITPVSTAQEGLNYFRVEARIDRPSQRLRPGMEGIGKVLVGERKLIWIWTHSLMDWLRLKAWNWLP
jgi:RND family efflux transporter MFP subunit